ncbi:nuclear transport factor 2 family protein [Nocardia blacklockiae]|uniref:nuclear transport factor 2 family protein n=1 Tax=Nocardia blacklockiae TaxID=480036 RepID=UPI0018961CDA|nr:nuclear transport factor 2 family protein [Nocardia blacklockiae]MBF6174211.1 nuclear transport factor 2 family protein [Nocardia blacklockiae]
MTDHPHSGLAIRYLEAVAAGADLTEYLHPDIVQHEYPNALVPEGATRDLAAILAAAEQGRKTVREQRFEIHGVLASDDRVAVESTWTGTLAVPLGPLPAGTVLSAEIAVFLVVRDGRIVEQRNYDCYRSPETSGGG